MLMAVIAWVSAAPDAEAIIPEELDGKPVLQVFYGNDFQGAAPTVSVGGVFRYDAASSQLYIDRFRGRISVPVTWNAADQSFQLPTMSRITGGTAQYNSLIMAGVQGQQYLIQPNITFYVSATGEFGIGSLGTMINNRPAACYNTISASLTTNPYSTSPYNYVSMPNFIFDKGEDPTYPCSLLCVNSSDSNASLNETSTTNQISIYARVAFFVMDMVNAHAVTYDHALASEMPYDMQVAFTSESDTELQFENLYNQGIRYEYFSNGYGDFTTDENGGAWKFKWITGTIDREHNTITIPFTKTGGMRVPSCFGYDTKPNGDFYTRRAIYAYSYGYPLYGTFYDWSSPKYWTGYWFNDVIAGEVHQVLA